MDYILNIGRLLFGTGLWFFIIKSYIEWRRNVQIKDKLFKNVIYEVFFNIWVMEFTHETNCKMLNNPKQTDIIIHKYPFTAWQILLQSGFIKDIKLKDILILEQLYFQIEKLDYSIKKYYDSPFIERIRTRKTFLAITNRLSDLHNGFVNSPKFKAWKEEYAESFEKDYLELILEFKGKKFKPAELTGVPEKEKSS